MLMRTNAFMQNSASNLTSQCDNRTSSTNSMKIKSKSGSISNGSSQAGDEADLADEADDEHLRTSSAISDSYAGRYFMRNNSNNNPNHAANALNEESSNDDCPSADETSKSNKRFPMNNAESVSNEAEVSCIFDE